MNACPLRSVHVEAGSKSNYHFASWGALLPLKAFPVLPVRNDLELVYLSTGADR